MRGKPDLTVDGGYLEDSYFKRTPWRTGAGEYGRVIVRDSRSAYYVRQFDSLRGLDPSVFFTPGKDGYLLFASNLGGESQFVAHARASADSRHGADASPLVGRRAAGCH